jgi:sporulation protein YlmC with PRC-barrel domain
VFYGGSIKVEIEYGAEVVDKNGKVLGTVNHLVRNTWTGQISKFVVRSEKTGHFFFSPQDVFQATKRRIKLSIAFNESSRTP